MPAAFARRSTPQQQRGGAKPRFYSLTVSFLFFLVLFASQFSSLRAQAAQTDFNVTKTFSANASRPTGLALNTNTNKIYVTVTGVGSQQVNVLNATTHEYITSIQVGSIPTGIAVNSLTNKIYVLNSYDASISIINGNTDTVIKTISLGYSAYAAYNIAVNEITNKIYIPTNVYTDAGPGTVEVINGATDSHLKTITGAGWFDVAVNNTTNKIYVTAPWNSSTNNGIQIIDGNLDTLQTFVPVIFGREVFGIATDVVTNKIFVRSEFGVHVVDGVSQNKIQDIPLNVIPIGDIAVDALKSRVYVSSGGYNYGTSKVTVIDGQSFSILTEISIQDFARGIAVDQAQHFAYVANDGSGTITIIADTTVTTPSSDPIPQNDNLTVAANSGATIVPVLSNDEGTELTVVGYGGSPSGTVSVLDGVLRYTPKPNFSGSDTFTYMVQDKFNNTATATVNVTVTPASTNRPPVANAGPDQSLKTTGTTKPIALDGSQSSDPDADSLTYEWREGNTLLSTQQKPTVTLTIGDHIITLVVRDSHNVQAEDRVTIKVRKALLPRSVFVNARDGFGLLDGKVYYLDSGYPLRARITPKVEKTDRFFGTRPVKIWFDIAQITVTDDGTKCEPIPSNVNAAKRFLAVTRLISPSTNPSYDATFTTIDSKVTMEVRLSADVAMITILDKIIGSYAHVNADDLISIYSDANNLSVIAKIKKERFSPLPNDAKQWTNAIARATSDLALMDGKDKEAFKFILEKHLGKGDKSKESNAQKFFKVAKVGFRAWEIGELAGDFALVALATKGQSMRLSFEASPLKEGK